MTETLQGTGAYPYIFDGEYVKIAIHKGQDNPYKNDYATASIFNPGFSNPGRPNSITTEGLIEYSKALDVLRGLDVEYGVVSWIGPTTGFGANLDEFHERLQDQESFSTWWGDHLDRAVEIALKARAIPYHTISDIHGTGVYGGSLELPLAFDEVFTDNNAVMGYPESGLAVVPGLGGVALTFERAGRHNTELLVATAGTINGEVARRIGLTDVIDVKVPSTESIFKAVHDRIASGLKPLHQGPQSELKVGEIDISKRRVRPSLLSIRRIPQMMDEIEAAYQKNGLEGALRVNRDTCYELGLSDEFRKAVADFKFEQDDHRAQQAIQNRQQERRIATWLATYK